MRAYFTLLSRYNNWANQTLYAAIGTLPPEEIARDRRGFFRSISGALNHVLLADKVWLARMLGVEYGWFKSLDQILFDDFEELRREREATDHAILAAIPQLPLTGELSYVNSRREPTVAPWTVVLGHFFNHQTHHRGQAHDMLTQAGGKAPPLDILYFPRDSFQPG